MGDLVTRRIEVSAMHLHWVFDENNRDHQTSDLELLKPALVYGDHVRLFTPNDSFITFLKQSPDWDHVPPEVRLRIAQQVFKVLATQQEMPDFVRFWASENVENYGHFLRTGELQGRNPALRHEAWGGVALTAI